MIRHVLSPSSDNYRVVRWAPPSEDRGLFEYFPMLEKADMAVTFIGPEPRTVHAALSDARVLFGSGSLAASHPVQQKGSSRAA